MTLLERIKATIFGVEPPPRPEVFDDTTDADGRWLGTRHQTNGYRPEVSTPADDPAMDDIAAAGVQPVSKPAEIERAQKPQQHPVDRRS
jgi:hypothetical protein